MAVAVQTQDLRTCAALPISPQHYNGELVTILGSMKQEDKAAGSAHVAMLPGSPSRLFAQECQHCSSYETASVWCRCLSLTVQGCPASGLPIWYHCWITVKCWPVTEWPTLDLTPCSPIEVRAVPAHCWLPDLTFETSVNLCQTALHRKRLQLSVVTPVTIPNPTVLIPVCSGNVIDVVKGNSRLGMHRIHCKKMTI